MGIGTIISVAVSLLLGVLAVYFYLRPRALPVRLGYRATTRPLLVPGPLDTEGLVLKLGGNEVHEPWLWSAEVVNVGRQPVRVTDFDGPIYFEFPKASAFLQVQGERLWFQVPEDPDGPLQLGFVPSLMNPGERLEVAALTEARQEWSKPWSRVAGMDALVPLDQSAIERELMIEREALMRVARIDTWVAVLVGFVVAAIVVSIGLVYMR